MLTMAMEHLGQNGNCKLKNWIFLAQSISLRDCFEIFYGKNYLLNPYIQFNFINKLKIFGKKQNYEINLFLKI